jgi:hypothetical protein
MTNSATSISITSGTMPVGMPSSSSRDQPSAEVADVHQEHQPQAVAEPTRLARGPEQEQADGDVQAPVAAAQVRHGVDLRGPRRGGRGQWSARAAPTARSRGTARRRRRETRDSCDAPASSWPAATIAARDAGASVGTAASGPLTARDSSAFGSSTANSTPASSGRLRAVARPPWCSATSRTMYRPRPRCAPAPMRRPETSESNRRSGGPGGSRLPGSRRSGASCPGVGDGDPDRRTRRREIHRVLDQLVEHLCDQLRRAVHAAGPAAVARGRRAPGAGRGRPRPCSPTWRREIEALVLGGRDGALDALRAPRVR